MNQVQYANRVRNVATKPRSTAVAYVLFFLTGMIGFHMLYVRKPALAISKILTFNWFVIGMVIDIILMPKYVARANGQVAGQ